MKTGLTELEAANENIATLVEVIRQICVAGEMIVDDVSISGIQAVQFGNEFAEHLWLKRVSNEY